MLIRVHQYRILKNEGERMTNMQQKERLNVYLSKRLKRRLKDLSDDTGQSMNDLAVDAIKDWVDRTDGVHSAPDIVLDRMGQILNTLIMITQDSTNKEIKQLVGEIIEEQQTLMSNIKKDNQDIKQLLIEIRNNQ